VDGHDIAQVCHVERVRSHPVDCQIDGRRHRACFRHALDRPGNGECEHAPFHGRQLEPALGVEPVESEEPVDQSVRHRRFDSEPDAGPARTPAQLRDHTRSAQARRPPEYLSATGVEVAAGRFREPRERWG
jgi:hypothetical protein